MWNFKKYANNTAIIDEHHSEVHYSEIDTVSREISDIVGQRVLVASLCKNTIGSLIGYVSFISQKIVPMLLNANLEEELLHNLLNKYSPAYIWLPSEMVAENQFKEMKQVYSAYDYSLLKTAFTQKYDMHPELGLLLATSGSTGSPKFVRQSYLNILENAKSIVEYLSLSETERPITTLPMNYTYGLSIINSHLLVGATLLVTDKGIMQKEFWSFFKEMKATSFGGVPYTYEMLERLRFRKMDLPSLRYMTQAGGKLTVELHRKFAEYAHEKKKQFIVMYGQCEATARMGYLPADKAIEKCGSMGIAIPSGKFSLIDTNGNYISAPHITGELIYEGPNVTLGYAECGNDLIKGDERNGILKTGDMAQIDEDGYYYIVGRKKRFLKIYGNRVNLDEIDRMIKSKFENLNVASAGVDDHMYIFITDEAQSENVKQFIVDKTKINPAAYKIIVIDAIPQNDAGKILYAELAKYYQKA